MEWKYEINKKEWDLFFEDEAVSKIKIIEKPKNKINKFLVKVFISNFLVSKKNAIQMKSRNTTWLKQQSRKFRNIQDTEKYILIKKKFIEKKIQDI